MNPTQLNAATPNLSPINLQQALGDFEETQLRHMERTTVLGTPSGYVVAG